VHASLRFLPEARSHLEQSDGSGDLLLQVAHYTIQVRGEHGPEAFIGIQPKDLLPQRVLLSYAHAVHTLLFYYYGGEAFDETMMYKVINHLDLRVLDRMPLSLPTSVPEVLPVRPCGLPHHLLKAGVPVLG